MRKYVIGFFVLILLLLAWLPKIASTPIGKPFFVRALEAKTKGKIEIDSLRLAWFGPQIFEGVHYINPEVTGKVDELQINAPFWSFSGPFTLKNGDFSFQSGRIEQINGEVEGNKFQLTGVTNNGHIAVNGSAFSKDHFTIQGDLTNIPVAALDQLLKTDGLANKILGPLANIKGSAKLENKIGSIDLNVTSTNVQMVFRGELTEHAITLREPLTARIHLTPELSETLFKNANPLFLTGLESKSPVLIQISQNDFSFPLPFSLKKLKIGSGTLDMGQVKCQNGETLASVITLLKDSHLVDARQMNAWFTPVVFRVENGVVETGRMDLLLSDSIHICTWGNIDLERDQLHMFIGLPADTLQKSFGIRDLSKNYVLKIPVRGSTRHPDLVKGPAATKIAALIAGSGLIPKKGFFGELINAFSKTTEDKDVPAAKRPFPWEKS